MWYVLAFIVGAWCGIGIMVLMCACRDEEKNKH